MLRFRPASIKPKDRLKAWLDHLFLNAVGGKPRKTLILGVDGKNITFIPPENPALLLSKLVDVFAWGMRQAVPFFPKTSLAYALARIEKGMAHAQALTRITADWNGNSAAGIPGERDDPHVDRCFPDDSHFDDALFAETALGVYSEILNHTSKDNG